MATRIVVLGAGFGGLEFCKKISATGCEVTLIDRTNHHLFQPLLYQVATAGLSAAEVAQPIRAILRKKLNLEVLMDDVTGIDLAKREVVCSTRTLGYDKLVIALGSKTSYFGRPDWEKFAMGLKTLQEALTIRNHVLASFEKAENESDPEKIRELMTLVVIGGGPTGVEMAGAFAELTRNVLNRDFRRIKPQTARVILVEASPRVLAQFSEDLSESAKQQLIRLGVEVHVGTRVMDIAPNQIVLDNQTIRAGTIVWSAGVMAHPLTKTLGVPIDKAGRIEVLPDLSVPGHPEVFAVGDLAKVMDEHGKQVPGVSPAAIQMAEHVAKMLNAEIASGPKAPSERPKFKYWDKGSMATIGRAAAVAQVGKMKFTGITAWFAWLLVHLIFLVGFRNKLAVLLQWFYSYVTYKRGARIIWGGRETL